MEGIGVQIFTLALAAFYCVVVHAFRTSLGGNRTQRERYVRLALVLAALTIGLAAAKAFTVSAGVSWTAGGMAEMAEMADAFGAWRVSGETIAGAAVGLVAFAVVVLQGLVIRAAGAVTLQKELAAAIVETKRSTIALGALAGAPMVLLFTGAHPTRDEVMVYLIVAEAIALSIYFLVRTLRLFVRQKVSVLVWILYLCSVEVVPAWAVIVLAGRIV